MERQAVAVVSSMELTIPVVSWQSGYHETSEWESKLLIEQAESMLEELSFAKQPAVFQIDRAEPLWDTADMVAVVDCETGEHGWRGAEDRMGVQRNVHVAGDGRDVDLVVAMAFGDGDRPDSLVKVEDMAKAIPDLDVGLEYTSSERLLAHQADAHSVCRARRGSLTWLVAKHEALQLVVEWHRKSLAGERVVVTSDSETHLVMPSAWTVPNKAKVVDGASFGERTSAEERLTVLVRSVAVVHSAEKRKSTAPGMLALVECCRTVEMQVWQPMQQTRCQQEADAPVLPFWPAHATAQPAQSELRPCSRSWLW